MAVQNEPGTRQSYSRLQKFDERRNAEGICNRRGAACMLYYLIGMILLPIGLMFCLMGCYYGKKSQRCVETLYLIVIWLQYPLAKLGQLFN